MTVAVLDEDAARYVALLADAGVVALPFHDADDLVAMAPDTRLVIGSPRLMAAVGNRLRSLQVFQSTWAGLDALEGVELDCEVRSLPGVFNQQMREFVIGHLLAARLRIVERATAHSWDPTPPTDIAGSTVGVLGVGSIGSEVARALAFFEVTVRGCNTDGRDVPNVSLMFPVTEIQDFARGLDALVITLPSTPSTRGLVDGSLIDLLAPDAVLINIGRGAVVVTDDVVAALDSGRLSTAVLDVVDGEPLADDDPLWDVPNLVLTSHTAAISRPEDVVAFLLEGELLGGNT